METERDADAAVATEPRRKEPITAWQFGRGDDDRLRCLVKGSSRVREEVEVAMGIDVQTHGLGSCRRTFADRLAAVIQVRISRRPRS
jgi:hypothetical protein